MIDDKLFEIGSAADQNGILFQKLFSSTVRKKM